MSDWRSQLFRRAGKLKAIDSEIINNAASIGDSIASKQSNLPPIFTLKHLAYLSDAPYSLLRVIVSRKLSDPYKTFRIKKRGSQGEARYRNICVPDPELMRVQRWITKNVLANCEPHSAS